MSPCISVGRVFAALMIFAAAATVAIGQNETAGVEPSYEVSLQFVVGTTESVKGELPANLQTITRELKTNFGYSNYHVAGVLLGRVGNNGNYEYRSVSNIFGLESASPTPTFLEWTLAGLKRADGDRRKLEGSAFRFGAKVPIFRGRDDAGKLLPHSYENVGITAMRFDLTENRPTLIGTLSLPNTPGMVFLIMTAKAAD